MTLRRAYLLLCTQHEPTDLCAPWHCESCHLDEVETRGVAYLRCPECYHMYRTAGELRREYRRVVLQMSRTARWWGRRGWEPGKARHWWMALTARASRITFCQECLHDF